MAKVRIQVKRHSWHRPSLWAKYKRPTVRTWPGAPRFALRVRRVVPGDWLERIRPCDTVWYEEFAKIDPETVEQWMNDIFREPK